MKNENLGKMKNPLSALQKLRDCGIIDRRN